MSDLFGPQSRVRFAVLTRSQLDDVTEGKVTLGAVKVYLSLYARADFATWSCWPGFECIRRDLGCSKGTVSSALKVLCERGWVTKTKRRKPGPNGKLVNDSNLYLLPHPLAWITGNTVESSISDLSSPQQGLVYQTLLDQAVTRTQLNEEPLLRSGASPQSEPSKLREGFSTADWEDCQKTWRGRPGSDARGRFFLFGKRHPLAWEGERQVKERLLFFMECYEAASWPFPPLAHVFQRDLLLDGALEGLHGDTERASAPRRRS